MVKVTINELVCKGCGLCARACPKGVLALSKTKLNAEGYHPAEVVNPEACIGCACLHTYLSGYSDQDREGIRRKRKWH
ncbi:MAG: 4Fe-4S binding protein [Oscillospiraceae bacterium]